MVIKNMKESNKCGYLKIAFMLIIYKSIRIKYVVLGAVFLIVILIGSVGCRKQLQIPPPYSSIVTSQVFKDSVDATSALLGIYSTLINTGTAMKFGSGAATTFLGMASDELVPFNKGDQQLIQFYNNTLLSTNSWVFIHFWQTTYSLIYRTNAIIDGLKNSTGIQPSVANEIIGEAKFFRSYFYFYLTNLFGDVPLILSTDYKTTLLASRTSKEQVYQQIINDLKDAQALLPDDYSAAGGEKIRANKWGATSLLARVYLYHREWQQAETQSSAIINSDNYSLVSDLNSVFLTNSSEAIFQLSISSTTTNNAYNATPEGYNYVRLTPKPPTYYVSNTLLASFENNDRRKVSWLDSTVYRGVAYYYPYKYKVGSAAAQANGTVTEYYMVLRLAEQYLIRAEAKAQQNIDLVGAVSDINVIRSRAGLDSLPSSLTQTEILQAIAQERKVEFFAEWGHRWLDLNRSGQSNDILPPIKPLWQSYQQLFPIPFSELQADPNLIQNPGYN